MDRHVDRIRAYWAAGGILLFQISRCMRHFPCSRFHTTTYLPVSSALPERTDCSKTEFDHDFPSSVQAGSTLAFFFVFHCHQPRQAGSPHGLGCRPGIVSRKSVGRPRSGGALCTCDHSTMSRARRRRFLISRLPSCLSSPSTARTQRGRPECQLCLSIHAQVHQRSG